MKDFSKIEKALFRKFAFIVGVDEVGSGAIAGPIIACAILVKQDQFISEIEDSKRLSRIKRKKLSDRLKETCFYAIGSSSVGEIDKYNSCYASKLAMERAVNKLSKKYEFSRVISDFRHLDLYNKQIKVYPLTKADRNCFCVAAASIVAKVFRDSLMFEIHDLYPNYNFYNNVGYGTRNHQIALVSNGLLIGIHRKRVTENALRRYLNWVNKNNVLSIEEEKHFVI